MQLFLQIALLVTGVFLVVAVLLQHGKSYGLSGTIAGGAETFFGKDKGGRIDKLLSRLTTVIGVVFVVLSLLAFMTCRGGYSENNDYKTRLESLGFSSVSDIYEQDTTTDTTTK